MGALTLKTYSYKSRPWELRSKDTISLKDPYFPIIRVFMSQQKILRILPVVGEEEWLSDSSRFFESQTVTTSCLMKIDCQSEYIVEKNTVNESNIYHRKVSLEKTLRYLKKDIQEKQELTIILGPETDIHVISSLRGFHKLQDVLNVNIINPFGSREITNSILTIDDLKNHCVFLMTPIHEISPLLEVQLANFVDEGGELYSFNIPESTMSEISVLGNSFRTLQKVLSGNVLTKLPPLFIISPYLKPLIPEHFKTFVLGVPLNNYYLNSSKNPKNTVSQNILTLDANVIMKNNLTQTSCLLSPSNLNLEYQSFYIPVMSFWNDFRTYKTMFKSFVNSYPVLLYKNSIYNTTTILITLKNLLTTPKDK